MANTSARMLRLLSLLQTHRFWSGIELSDKLEVSERTLRRDVERLRELGYPVNASRGVAGGYQLRSGTVMPPLLLDDEEAVAIAVGLRTAASGSVEGIEETSVRALTKVVQVMPPRLRRRVDALQAYTTPAAVTGPRVNAASLTVIAQACRDDERLKFDYAARGGEESARLVEPHRLVSLGRRWYLVAWDLDRVDWRTFRVDRLSEPRTTGARYRPREIPGGDAVKFVEAQIKARPTTHTLVVRVQAPKDRVESAVRYLGGALEAIDESSCRLTMNVDTFDWPVLILAAIGAPFEVESPSAFKDHLASVAALFTAASIGP
ncbi:helix-turn-helix transcriptional regulator [Amycolatopsis keratiniphila]|uniref:helix-turn-helix transcriptional regulator n=1 Tax=Amycolatopsis keratiniphila TaxID=129921 RepID=UPI00087D244D|nr:YafY family protein [Amycolatopsis keratiniphila]SDT99482.1 Predicted DNA-binding transcriptional regulator YafY, contains an HTH and WYL domains [Amycolatopsis keratiniphila]